MIKHKIIAEIGINHNGQLDMALELIDKAYKAGVHAVKFQMREARVVYADIWNNPRNDGNPYGWTTQGEQKVGLELSLDDYGEINKHCGQLGLPWFASAWDMNSLEITQYFNMKYNKIASAMLSHCEFVEAVAANHKKTFISIGGAYPWQVEKVVEIFRKHQTPFVLMHCVVGYPVPDNQCNISKINYLKAREFTNGFEVGYSGHEVGILPSIVAMALGAEWIERHITLDRSMYGSDQPASLEIPGLIRLVEYANNIGAILGDGSLDPQPSEAEVLKKLRYWEK